MSVFQVLTREDRRKTCVCHTEYDNVRLEELFTKCCGAIMKEALYLSSKEAPNQGL